MKKIILIFALLLSTVILSQKKNTPFKEGEWLKFKMSYSGFLKAGEVELSLKKEILNGKEVIHASGKGKTSTIVGWFFKVKDYYDSYFDIKTGIPYLFKRNIREGSYNKNIIIVFDHEKKQANIKDILHKKDTIISIGNIQDMLSTFYFLRKLDISNIKINDYINVNMFIDEKTFPMKLRFLGRDIVKTKFGKIKTMIFQPFVKSGRIFKAKESVKVWISDDNNKIPIKMKAELSVGSLSAELIDYKGLVNSFKKDN